MKWITTTILVVAIVLSTNSCVKGQDFEDRQVQEAQERRLMDIATFEDLCVASAEAAFGTDYSSNPSDSYVNCDHGFVEFTSQTCADACNGLCCTGGSACGELESDGRIDEGFTGKGKKKFVIRLDSVLFMTHISDTHTNTRYLLVPFSSFFLPS